MQAADVDAYLEWVQLKLWPRQIMLYREEIALEYLHTALKYDTRPVFKDTAIFRNRLRMFVKKREDVYSSVKEPCAEESEKSREESEESREKSSKTETGTVVAAERNENEQMALQ